MNDFLCINKSMYMCAGCGQSFRSNRKKKYCSSDCYPKRKQFQATKLCVCCKKMFIANRKGVKYCCSYCRNKHTRKPKKTKPWIEVQCKICGYVFKTKKTSAKFCSKEHQRLDEYKKRHGRYPVNKDSKEEKEHREARKARKLAEQNARQAWRYWVKHKAPLQWRDKYYAVLKKRHSKKKKSRRPFESITAQMRAAIRNGKESRYVERWVGYSIDDLKRHLEKQFIDGMTWDAFNKGDVHIDHIVPISTWSFETREDVRACWALSNLRPLWKHDNWSKGSKVDYLL